MASTIMGIQALPLAGLGSSMVRGHPMKGLNGASRNSSPFLACLEEDQPVVAENELSWTGRLARFLSMCSKVYAIWVCRITTIISHFLFQVFDTAEI